MKEMWSICRHEYELKEAFIFKLIQVWYFANRGRSGTILAKAPGRSPKVCQFLIPVNEIEGEKHFIVSCPQYEDLRASIRTIGEAEHITVTEDTVMLHFPDEFETQVNC